MRPRLWVRMLASYTVIIAVGAGVTYLTVRLLAPHLFDQQMHGQGMRGMGAGQGTRQAFRSALNSALLVAVTISAAVAGLVAALVTRRIVHPVTAVRDATRRVAAGDYGVRVPVPPVPELAALAADVNTLAAALADTETRRTRLLGDVAHEMRTPLTALDGYVEGLVDGVFTADEQTLTALTEELRRLHRLADDLASLSRAEERRLDLHPAAVDLATIARRTADRLATQFADAGVALRVDADGEVVVVADRQRIEQVLTNLLGNAVAATAAGGAVTVAVRSRNATATVTVSDTGLGLVAEDVERVFERFYRVPGERRRQPGGSGIGLTIARSIARAHGGELTAASDGPGTGARFTLTLPQTTRRG